MDYCIFLFSVFDALAFGTLLIRERQPLAGLSILRNSKHPAWKCAFHIQTNQSRAHTRNTISIWLSYFRRQYFSALILPGPDTRRETAPVLQSPVKLSKVTNPTPT